MKRLSLVILFCLAVTVLHAQNDTIHPPRLKVGVVLGGGGAKGAAHIGVLKYLEEMGIPIDYVAGTSMGSIIGGLYSLGYTPDQLTQLISGMDWSEYIGNKIDRSSMSKEMRHRNSTMLFSVPFSLESLREDGTKSSFISQLPSAYVNNSSLINLFNDLCVGYQEQKDFNDLPIPFACVATDMITGKEVVLRHGSVPTAMRASMAIPGVFSPVQIDDMVLVDGGLVNNFPADVLLEMGADIIIGIEITSNKSFTADDLQSLPQVFARLVTNSTSAKREENRELCNLYIVPDVSGYGTLSFTPEAIDTLVERGYKKAVAFHDQLLRIKQAVDYSAGHPVGKTLHAPKAKNIAIDTVMVRSITINNASGSQSRWLIRKGRLKTDCLYTQTDIEQAMQVYRGTGCFDEITYNVKEIDSLHQDRLLEGLYDLSVTMKPAKPHVFGLGLRYDTEEGAALLLNLGLNEKKFNGSKLNLNLKLSYNPKVNLTYTFSKSSLANFSLAYDYRSENFNTTNLYADNLVSLKYQQQKLSAYISQFHLLNVNTTVGVSYINTTYYNSSIEGSFLDSVWFAPSRFLTPYANVKFDNLDDAYYAKHGLCAKVYSHYYWNPKNSEENNFDLGYSIQYCLTPWNGRFTFIPQLYGRFFLNGLTTLHNMQTNVGGAIEGRHFDTQMPFIGINYVEALGNLSPTINVARCDLRYNFYGKHYLTAMYNALLRPYKYTYHGAGLQYSYNSLFGPIAFTVQWTNFYKSQVSVYFSFGYTF